MSDSAALPDSAAARRRLFFPERWPPVVLATALIGALTLLVYGGTFTAPFIFDDLPGIVRNPSIRSLWPLQEVLLPEKTSGTGADGRPIVNLSLALNYALGGLDVRGYHVFNVLVHIATAVLLFSVLRRTWGQPVLRERFAPAATALALGGALLWALHPLQTESVSCVIQRTELLVALFYLLALYAFIRAATDGSRGWTIGTIGACALGMVTKEVMVTAPVVLFLYDRTFVAGSFAAAWRARRGLYLALAATWIPLAWLVVRGGGRGGSVGFGFGVTPWDYLLTQCRALVLYLKLAFWPSPLVLDYGTGVVRNVSDVLPQMLVLVILGGGTVWAVWRKPALGFVGACFFITLSPSSSFVPLVTQTIAEHRMYLPLAAILGVTVAGLHCVCGRGAMVVVLLAAIFFGGLTWQRNGAFASSLDIWADTVAKAPDNARAHYNFANALSEAGRLEGAVHSYKTALGLEPRYGAAHFNLAGALLRLGRIPEAIAHYEATLRLNPNAADAHANLAGALIRQGRMAEAVAHYEAAARLGMLAAEENRRFGRALAEVGRVDEALVRLQEAARLAPRDAETRVILGMVLAAAGREAEALKHLTEAVIFEPDDAGARCALADALMEAKRPAEALSHYEAALRLQPGQGVMLHTSIGNAQALLGRVAEALAHYEAALRIDPNAAETRRNLEQVRSTAIRRGLIKN